MQKIIIAICLAAAFSACNNASENKSEATAKTAAQEPTAQAVSNGKKVIDPVCGMEKDSTWTDYTVYKGDTVWFCAESEKTAFLANPAKYEAQLIK